MALLVSANAGYSIKKIFGWHGWQRCAGYIGEIFVLPEFGIYRKPEIFQVSAVRKMRSDEGKGGGAKGFSLPYSTTDKAGM